MKTLVLNGQFFIQKTTGQQRYAKEILTELDKITGKDGITLVVPDCAAVPEYQNIRVVRFGKVQNRLWEQICLPLYCIKNKCRALSFCNTTPLFTPGPSVIHDIILKEHPEYFTTYKGRIARFYYSWNLNRLAKSRLPIITVTEYSKKRISSLCKISSDRITVIGNAWQHFKRIRENSNYFTEHPEIKRGTYYFALGSRAAQKNFKWIYKNAERNPRNLYLIAGKTVTNFSQKEKLLPNLKYLGFISDEDVKALMKGCKAFIFPSAAEGFGIPPLEALSVGAAVIASSASCIPEVMGKACVYIDPQNAGVDLDKIIKDIPAEEVQKTLDRYSWKKSAGELYSFIRKFKESA